MNFYRLRKWKKIVRPRVKLALVPKLAPLPTGTSPNWHFPHMALPPTGTFCNFLSHWELEYPNYSFFLLIRVLIIRAFIQNSPFFFDEVTLFDELTLFFVESYGLLIKKLLTELEKHFRNLSAQGVPENTFHDIESLFMV